MEIKSMVGKKNGEVFAQIVFTNEEYKKLTKFFIEKQNIEGDTESYFAEKWKEWMESTGGLNCSDPSGINAPENQKKYIINRLFLAFAAGWNAREK